jgi:hypothetical protein
MGHLRLVPPPPKKPRRLTRTEYRWTLPYGAWVCKGHVTIFNRRYIPILSRWEDGTIGTGATAAEFDYVKPILTQENRCDRNPMCPVACLYHRYRFQMYFYDDDKVRNTPHKKLVAELEAMQDSFLANGPLFEEALNAAMTAKAAKMEALLAAMTMKLSEKIYLSRTQGEKPYVVTHELLKARMEAENFVAKALMDATGMTIDRLAALGQLGNDTARRSPTGQSWWLAGGPAHGAACGRRR